MIGTPRLTADFRCWVQQTGTQWVIRCTEWDTPVVKYTVYHSHTQVV